MKGVILYAEYNAITGISTVTKETKYGTFTRSVKVHKDDLDIANRFDGCYFAEMKCDIAAYKEKAKVMRQRALGVQHLYNVLENSGIYNDLYNEDDDFIYTQVDEAWQIAKAAKETYEILRDTYSYIVESTLKARREMRSRIETKRS